MTDKQIEECNNMSLAEIRDHIDRATQGIRARLSAILMFTSEDNPIKCEITLEPWGDSLSSLDKPLVTHLFQEPGQGIIWANIYGIGCCELDDIPLQCQLDILEYFDEFSEF